MSKIFGLITLLVGIGVLTYSTTLQPYTDKEEFYEKMSSLMDEENNSQKYHELRDFYLTPKYALENYGLIAVILGLYTLLLIPDHWWNFQSPRSKWIIGVIGLLAVLLTIGGYVGDLFLEATRDRYPPWADSLGIPLMSVPFLFWTFLGWFAVNLIGFKKPFRTSVSIQEFKIRSTNYWYLALTVLTAIITLTLMYEGDFWWTAAGIMWIYFYLSLLLGRQKKEFKD